MLRSWLGIILVKLLLDKLGHRVVRAKLLCKLLVDTGMLLKIMLPISWKMMLAACSTPIKACNLIKLLDLLKRRKLDNDISKLDAQAAERRLVLGSFLLPPEAQLTICASEVQADCMPKLQSFMLRSKALRFELKADDASCFRCKLWCSASCPSPEVDGLSKAARSLPIPKIGIRSSLHLLLRKLIEACSFEALHRKLAKNQEELKLIRFCKVRKQLLEESCFKLCWVLLKLFVDKLPFEDVGQQTGVEACKLHWQAAP